jgi:methionyl-tRNA synthetase|tara:strand:- start:570 stop:2258 length:1689 start_codon:yes stop_codon:yes gene_type:complete
MSKLPKRYTVTAALPYTNGPLHIGHLAGVYVPADIYCRFLRCKKRDVIFICGSDEHGVAISIKAKKENKSPQEIVDKYDKLIRDSFKDFGISFDNYSRTSLPIHHETATDFFNLLKSKNKFFEKESEQLFDVKESQFLADRFVTGTCPVCQEKDAYGDQCESCGTSLSPDELINPKSTLSGSVPIKRKTKHWYIPLNEYEDFIRNWILKDHKNDWKPNVYGQVKSWIKNGLKARAVTRDLDWGIPLPIEGENKKVLYVWFEAPIGYISSTKEWAENKNVDWKPYWKSSDTKLVHFIGKDNIVFHCIIFPIMLHSSGEYILPDNVPANEFLNLEGSKISTSKNWAVWLHEYLQDFPNKQDELRYALASNTPENKDNDFTWAEYQSRNNNELVSIFGNFFNRILVLTHKYFSGKTPYSKNPKKEDTTILDELRLYPSRLEDAIEKYSFREFSTLLMNLARLGNKYLADQEPWKLMKENPERVKEIIFIGIQISAGLAILCEPLLPFTSIKMKKILNLNYEWDQVSENTFLIDGGHQINQPELLFEKIEDDKIMEQLKKLKSEKK